MRRLIHSDSLPTFGSSAQCSRGSAEVRAQVLQDNADLVFGAVAFTRLPADLTDMLFGR